MCTSSKVSFLFNCKVKVGVAALTFWVESLTEGGARVENSNWKLDFSVPTSNGKQHQRLQSTLKPELLTHGDYLSINWLHYLKLIHPLKYSNPKQLKWIVEYKHILTLSICNFVFPKSLFNPTFILLWVILLLFKSLFGLLTLNCSVHSRHSRRVTLSGSRQLFSRKLTLY